MDAQNPGPGPGFGIILLIACGYAWFVLYPEGKTGWAAIIWTVSALQWRAIVMGLGGLISFGVAVSLFTAIYWVVNEETWRFNASASWMLVAPALMIVRLYALKVLAASPRMISPTRRLFNRWRW